MIRMIFDFLKFCLRDITSKLTRESIIISSLIIHFICFTISLYVLIDHLIGLISLSFSEYLACLILSISFLIWPSFALFKYFHSKWREYNKMIEEIADSLKRSGIRPNKAWSAGRRTMMTSIRRKRSHR